MSELGASQAGLSELEERLGFGEPQSAVDGSPEESVPGGLGVVRLSQACLSEVEAELEAIGSPGGAEPLQPSLSQVEKQVETLEGSTDPLQGQFAGEVLSLAGISCEEVYELAAKCDTSWLKVLEERGPLLEHLIREPGPTWRKNVPSKRRVALGKAFEPILAAAVTGRLDAWKALEVAMRLLFRAPTRSVDAEKPEGENGFSVDWELAKRLAVVKERGWEILAREYIADREAHDRQVESRAESPVGGDGIGPKGRAADRACRFAKLGEWGRAASAQAGAKILEPRAEWGGEPALVAAMETKVLPPQRGERERWELVKGRVQPAAHAELAGYGFGVSPDHFEQAAKSSARGSAQAWGGWRLEHVRAFCHLKRDPAQGRSQGSCAWGLLQAVGLVMITGGAPAWVYDYIRSPKIIPLEKKEGVLDPRPVGCVDVLWRWATRALMFSVREVLANHLAPHQYAVGRRAGIEALVHGLEEEISAMQEACWLSGDVENAFNAVDRAAMLEAVAQVSPALAVAVVAMYDGPTGYRYKGKDGVQVLWTERGCVQGDPLSMAVFCLAIRAPIRWIANAANAVASGGQVGPWAEPAPPSQVREHIQQWVEHSRQFKPTRDSVRPNESVTIKPRFYADDGVWRVPRWLLKCMPELIAECFAVVGLAMKASKWEAWASEEGSQGLTAGDAGPLVQVRGPGEGLVVAGAPLSDEASMPAAAVVVGGRSFAQAYLAKVVKRAEVMCDAVAEMPEYAAAAYPSRKIALRIIVDCVKPRFAYFTRVTKPEITRPIAKEFDQVVSTSVRRVLGFSQAEAAQSARQASMRPMDGGLGLLPEARRCCYAYLGSWLDSAEALIQDFDVFAHAGSESVIGQRLRHVYALCVQANPTKLPGSLAGFLQDSIPEEVESKYKRRDGSVRWQALLMRGKDAAEAESWLQSAGRATRHRLAEMGGAWVFAPDVKGCTLTAVLWQIAMRLRFGLSVVPALPERPQRTRVCQMVNSEGEGCGVRLDTTGNHACACQKGSQQLHRHRVIVRALGRELTRRGLIVAEEQWVDELTKRVIEDTPEGPQVRVKEARLDLVVRDGLRLWWVDFSCFHPLKGDLQHAHRGVRTTHWALKQREGDKHSTYRVRGEGGTRKATNGRVVPLIANSYGAVGREALSFFSIANSVARRLGRSCAKERLEPFVQSLVIFHVASGVLDAYCPRSE